MTEWSFCLQNKYNLVTRKNLYDSGRTDIRYTRIVQWKSYYDIWFLSKGFIIDLYFKPSWYML